MKEGALSGKLAKLVRVRGGWCRKVHGGPYGAGWPDLVGAYRGIPLAIETKLPGKEKTLTELQRQTLLDMRRAGFIALVITNVRQLDYVLDCIDRASDTQAAFFSVGRVVQREARHRYENKGSKESPR